MDLYALPPGEFTAARDAAVKQARRDKDLDAVRALEVLRRPSVAAYAVNRLVHDEPALLTQLLDLGAALARAQSSGDAAALRQLGAQRRALVEAVADRAGQLVDALGPGPRAEVVATLEAAMADPASADAVRTGRLVRALSYAGFGGVDLDDAVAPTAAVSASGRADPAPDGAAPRPGPNGSPDGAAAERGPVAARRDVAREEATRSGAEREDVVRKAAARRKVEREESARKEALRREAITAAEAAVQQACGEVDDAVVLSGRARRRSGTAQRDLAEAEGDLDARRGNLGAAERTLSEARSAVRAAEQLTERAREQAREASEQVERTGQQVTQAQLVTDGARRELDALRRD